MNTLEKIIITGLIVGTAVACNPREESERTVNATTRTEQTSNTDRIPTMEEQIEQINYQLSTAPTETCPQREIKTSSESTVYTGTDSINKKLNEFAGMELPENLRGKVILEEYTVKTNFLCGDSQKDQDYSCPEHKENWKGQEKKEYVLKAIDMDSEENKIFRQLTNKDAILIQLKKGFGFIETVDKKGKQYITGREGIEEVLKLKGYTKKPSKEFIDEYALTKDTIVAKYKDSERIETVVDYGLIKKTEITKPEHK